MNCDQDIEESAYPQHMMEKHPSGQLAAITAKKNVPHLPNLPPGINPGDLPSDEFMKTVAEIEKAKQTPPTPQPVASRPPPTPPVKKEHKFLKLEYKWSGDCPECEKPIETLEVKIAGRASVVAWCNEHKQMSYHVLPPIETLYEEDKKVRKNASNI